MIKSIKKNLAVSALLLLFTSTVAAEQAVIVRTAALKGGPSFTSSTLRTLPPGAQVELLRRDGGWQQIRVTGKPVALDGWVRTYQVRSGINPAEAPSGLVKNEDSNDSVLANLSRSASGLFGRREMDKADRNDLVATVGIRGLSEADLKKAKPNPEEFKKLEDYAADSKTAKRYAQQAGLRISDVEELPKP